MLTQMIVPSDILAPDGRIRAVYTTCQRWHYNHGVQFALGGGAWLTGKKYVPCIDGMMNFPIYIHRSTFEGLRQHIIKVHGARSFRQAHQVSVRIEPSTNAGSQPCIFCIHCSVICVRLLSY